MADERSKNGIRCWKSQAFGMRGDKSGRAVRALFSRSAKLRSALRQIALISHTHAMMLPIATATRGQARHFARAQREQRRDDREAEDGQQQDGKQSTQ
jgi:hypothetical protein